MKVQKLAFASLLFLLLGAGLAGAAPQTAPAVASDENALADLAPADVFGVSVLNVGGDCAKAVKADKGDKAVEGTNPWSVCGTCSQAPCNNGAPINNVCGFANGKFKRCVNWLGDLCPAEDGAACRCTSDPLP